MIVLPKAVEYLERPIETREGLASLVAKFQGSAQLGLYRRCATSGVRRQGGEVNRHSRKRFYRELDAYLAFWATVTS